MAEDPEFPRPPELKLTYFDHAANTYASITAKLQPGDLDLPWEVFAERYAEPAFKQLAAEMKYLLDHP